MKFGMHVYHETDSWKKVKRDSESAILTQSATFRAILTNLQGSSQNNLPLEIVWLQLNCSPTKIGNVILPPFLSFRHCMWNNWNKKCFNCPFFFLTQAAGLISVIKKFKQSILFCGRPPIYKLVIIRKIIFWYISHAGKWPFYDVKWPSYFSWFFFSPNIFRMVCNLTENARYNVFSSFAQHTWSHFTKCTRWHLNPLSDAFMSTRLTMKEPPPSITQKAL